MTERTILMQLVEEAETAKPDWDDALRRAGFVGRTFPAGNRLGVRRSLVLVAAALVGLYAVAAFAADKPLRPVYWLFDRSPQTSPVVQKPTLGKWELRERAGRLFVRTKSGYVPKIERLPVIAGEVAGHRWEMVVVFGPRVEGGETLLLIVGINPGGTPALYRGTDAPAWLGGAAAGYSVRWMPGGQDAEERVVWGGVYIPGPIAGGGGTGPKWHFGPAAPNVAEVALENEDGRVVRVPTFDGPKTLGAPTRLWVAALPLTHLVHAIAARDANGKVLERHRLPIAQ